MGQLRVLSHRGFRIVLSLLNIGERASERFIGRWDITQDHHEQFSGTTPGSFPSPQDALRAAESCARADIDGIAGGSRGYVCSGDAAT